MNTYADKTQDKSVRSQWVANEPAQKQDSSAFQFVDNRPETAAQRKLQEIVNNSPQAAQLKASQDMVNKSQAPISTFSNKKVVQKSDDDLDSVSNDGTQANNVNITDQDDDIISSVWICGGTVTGQHQEVICVIGSRGFLRFSRNNGSDTAMSTNQARLPIIEHISVNNVTVADARTAYTQVHNLWPRYEQADCQTFAQEIVFLLTNQHVLNHGEASDDFM